MKNKRRRQLRPKLKRPNGTGQKNYSIFQKLPDTVMIPKNKRCSFMKNAKTI